MALDPSLFLPAVVVSFNPWFRPLSIISVRSCAAPHNSARDRYGYPRVSSSIAC